MISGEVPNSKFRCGQPYIAITNVRMNSFLNAASNMCLEAELELGNFIRPTRHLSEPNFVIGGAIHIVGEQDRAAAFSLLLFQQLAGSDNA